MDDNIVLLTERLRLRPWSSADADDLFAYAADPRIGPAAGWPPHRTREESQQVIENVLKVPLTFAIELKSTGQVIGSIGLKVGSNSDLLQSENECEVGYWVAVPYWGQGLAGEATNELLRYAFENLGYQRIWCSAFEENVQSQAVQRKAGFTFHSRIDNKEMPLIGLRKNLLVSALSKTEWAAQQ